MDLPNEFFTTQSFFTLAGSTFIVLLVCNTAQEVFNFKPKWFVLIISIFVSLIAVSQTNSPIFIDWVIGVVNGCLICLTALGSNSIINKKPPNVEEVKDPRNISIPLSYKKRNFFSDWLSD